LRQIEAEQLKRLMAAQQAQVEEPTDTTAPKTVRNETKLPGRNDPCPCGSGKKFKVCHLGREQELIALMSKKPAAQAPSEAKVVRGKQK